MVDSDEDDEETDSDEDDEDTGSDPPSQVNEGIAWRYGGFIDSDEDDDCEYRAILLGERTNISVRGEGKTPVVHYIFTLTPLISLIVGYHDWRDHHHSTASGASYL